MDKTEPSLQPQPHNDDSGGDGGVNLNGNGPQEHRLDLVTYPREGATERFVTLSAIGLATGITNKTLRKRMGRLDAEQLWRPSADEIKQLVALKAFPLCVNTGILVRLGAAEILAPELIADCNRLGRKKRKASASASSHHADANSDADSDANSDADVPSVHDEVSALITPPAAKRPARTEAELLRLDLTPAPGPDDDNDSAAVATFATMPARPRQHSPSPPPNAVTVAALAAAAGAGGIMMRSVVDDGSAAGALPVFAPAQPPTPTAGQLRRRGIVKVPDNVDAVTAFKLRVINAVSRAAYMVPAAKSHQYRRVASAIVTSAPGTAIKRSGSHNSIVHNDTLVRSRLFTESLTPSIAGLRPTIAVAVHAVWQQVATELGVV